MQFPVATVEDAYKPGARWLSRKAPHLADLIMPAASRTNCCLMRGGADQGFLLAKRPACETHLRSGPFRKNPDN
jgi:hypothetical protein